MSAVMHYLDHHSLGVGIIFGAAFGLLIGWAIWRKHPSAELRRRIADDWHDHGFKRGVAWVTKRRGNEPDDAVQARETLVGLTGGDIVKREDQRGF